MNDEDLVKLVDEAVALLKPASMADMGKVIGYIKGKAPNADGGKIAQMVKSKIG